MILLEGVILLFLTRVDGGVVAFNPAFLESVTPPVAMQCAPGAQSRLHMVSGQDVCVRESVKDIAKAVKP